MHDMTESEIISEVVNEKLISTAKVGYLIRIHYAYDALNTAEFQVVKRNEQKRLERLLINEEPENLHKWFDFKRYNLQTSIIVDKYKKLIKKKSGSS